jgi:hypothetical protein
MQGKRKRRSPQKPHIGSRAAVVGRCILHELYGVLGNVGLHDTVGQGEKGARRILRHVLWLVSRGLNVRVVCELAGASGTGIPFDLSLGGLS